MYRKSITREYNNNIEEDNTSVGRLREIRKGRSKYYCADGGFFFGS